MSNPIASALASVFADLAPTSRRVYEIDWRRYMAWCASQGIDPLTATPKVIKAHIAWMREQTTPRGVLFGRATIGHALTTIRQIYGALVADEVIAVNPAREIKRPKMNSAPRAPHLTEAQVLTFFAAQPCSTWIERRDRLVLQTLFGLGFRRAEVARMRGDDFDGATVTALVKGGKTITVGVPAWLLKEIGDWKAFARIDDGPLFPWSPAQIDRPITGDSIYGIVKRAELRAGFDKHTISPHGFRRTNITIAGEKGVSLKERQLAVWHNSSQTTERYDRARDAAASAPGNVFANLMNVSSRLTDGEASNENSDDDTQPMPKFEAWG